MGQIQSPEPVKLFVGMLSAYPGAFAEAEARLGHVLGKADLHSDMFAHEFTDYYRDEMGHPLLRYFISLEDPIPPERLVTIKRLTNEIEADIASRGEWPVARPVNLDPGYVAPSKLVLASVKDFAHRIYLGDGIYAEVTLQYRRGEWTKLPWTFPDYRTPEYHAFFTQVRGRLMAAREARRIAAAEPGDGARA